MNNDKIIEGNKLIAEFMEWKIYKDIFYTLPTEFKNPFGIKQDIPAEGLIFHSSWEWLMDVVEKITSSDKYYKYREYNSSLFSDGRIHINTKYISDTWEQVVEFINWYNQQNK